MPYNPFWIASDWGDLAINATLSAYMNGYNDPRISKYMNTSTSYRSIVVYVWVLKIQVKALKVCCKVL